MTEPTHDPAPGIDHQLGAGVGADDMGLDEERPDEGRGRDSSLRTDPDQPEEGLRAAEEASEEAVKQVGG